MASTPTRILFVGDMHLGTRPSRLPAGLGDAERLGPTGAWARTVDAALAHRVQAVALAGDVVNKRNALFEAAAALRPGLEKLHAAGITTLAVAGNHDTRALPALIEGGAPLQLLGAGGQWQEHTVGGNDRPAVRIVGWSFPRERWEASPLAVPPPPARPDLPTFGLLHADLDVPASPYAPVGRIALAAIGYDGWMLGHIHTPGAVPADARPFYLGSLTGLDPSETGEHGPVLVTVAAGGAITRERLPLAPLRWERWDVPCPVAPASPDDLQEMLLRELETRTAGLGLVPGAVLGVRVVLAGPCDRPLAAASAAAGLALPPVTFDGVTVFVDRLESALRTDLDLAALARGDDPPGLLASRILVLEDRGSGPAAAPELARLLQLLRDADTEARRFNACTAAAPADDAELRSTGARAARRLLDRLLTEPKARP